jgi:flavin reductase ActVB
MVAASPAESAELPLIERQERFRAAMARYPSGVVIVTTAGLDGEPVGFTATSFCSVSMAPPLVLFCLGKAASCHPAFMAAGSWTVNVLGQDQGALAMRFATRGADKFGGGEFQVGRHGNPVLAQACLTLECDRRDVHDAGDHSILLGEVIDARALGAPPAVYVGRSFRRLDADNTP